MRLVALGMRNLPRPGVEPVLPTQQVDSSPLSHQGSLKKFFALFLQNCFCESDVIFKIKKKSLVFKKSKLFIIALKGENNSRCPSAGDR